MVWNRSYFKPGSLDAWGTLVLGQLMVKSSIPENSPPQDSTPKAQSFPTDAVSEVLCDRCARPMFRMRAVYWCECCGYKTDCCGH
jgi:hypothetical protein